MYNIPAEMLPASMEKIYFNELGLFRTYIKQGQEYKSTEVQMPSPAAGIILDRNSEVSEHGYGHGSQNK